MVILLERLDFGLQLSLDVTGNSILDLLERSLTLSKLHQYDSDHIQEYQSMIPFTFTLIYGGFTEHSKDHIFKPYLSAVRKIIDKN
jgi:hypothetical protein